MQEYGTVKTRILGYFMRCAITLYYFEKSAWFFIILIKWIVHTSFNICHFI